MTSRSEKRLILAFSLAAVLLVSHSASLVPLGFAQPYFIELEEFRWNRYPLKILVDMNEWSVPDYAVAVRNALDSWVKSVWNYTHVFNDTSLPAINYVLYLSTENFTSNYDVLVTFAANRMPPSSNTVGVTTFRWNDFTHEPIPSITINVTTYSATASSFFVKNVVMHEFGHALGLGHASSLSTSNGPELMYYTSSKDEVVYPSTLDVYGLTELYRGIYGQSVELPSNMPYIMLAQGAIPPPEANLPQNYRQYLPIAIVLSILIIAAIALGEASKKRSPADAAQQPPPPPPVVSVEANGH